MSEDDQGVLYELLILTFVSILTGVVCGYILAGGGF